MPNSSTTAQFIASACLLPILCCTLFFFGIQHFINYLKINNKILIKLFGNKNKGCIFVSDLKTIIK